MAVDYPTRVDLATWPGRDLHTGQSYGPVEVTVGGEYAGIRMQFYNGQIGWNVLLKAGTWALTFLHTQASDGGIAVITLGAIAVGSVDLFPAGFQPNVITTFAGIVVPTSGLYLLKFDLTTKNAASGGNKGEFYHLTLQRTGA